MGLVLVTGAGCGLAQPLQSSLPTQTPAPTQALASTASPTPTQLPGSTATIRPVRPSETDVPADTSTPTLTPTITKTPTPGPSPTPDTRATSEAVFATITALAATPTYPPTSTPRPRRTPIIAGPDKSAPSATPIFKSGEIAVQTMSQQVFPGGAAALTIETQPGAVCILRVERTSDGTGRAEPIGGDATHVAGHDGVAAWLWTVDVKEPAGMMTLLIDCGATGQARVQMRVVEE